MKKIVFSLMAFALTATAFGQIKEGFQQSDTKVLYKIEKQNKSGKQIREGDIVIGGYSVAYGDSLVFSSLDKEPQPCFRAMREGRQFLGDMMDALLLMREGERYTFAFAYDSIAKMQQMPPFMKKTDYVYYTVDAKATMTLEEFEAIQRKAQAEQQKLTDSLQALEMQTLIEYVRANGFSDIPTNGVYYKQIQKGNGFKPANGDNARVHYVGRFLDGKVFDTSVESVAKESGNYTAQRDYSPLEFTLGKRQMIQGFEAAVAEMSVGEKGIVVIPSSLAYGARARGEIPAFSTLIFELELVEIIKQEAGK